MAFLPRGQCMGQWKVLDCQGLFHSHLVGYAFGILSHGRPHLAH